MNEYSIALHEASHAACARVLNRDVDHVWREVGTVLAGETAGFASVPIGERIEASQVPVVLIGYMSTDTEGWPPSYENALVEKREALGAVLVLLDIDEKQCREYVEFTCDLLADEEFVRFRDSIARALMTVRESRARRSSGWPRSTSIPNLKERWHGVPRSQGTGHADY